VKNPAHGTIKDASRALIRGSGCSVIQCEKVSNFSFSPFGFCHEEGAEMETSTPLRGASHVLVCLLSMFSVGIKKNVALIMQT